jgi:hypothetical protein
LSALPFDSSRRLTGANLFFSSPGAVLEIAGIPATALLIEAWRDGVARAAKHLHWPPLAVARLHASGASLAIGAPFDQLFLATEVNEWALCAAIAAQGTREAGELEHLLVAQAREQATDGGLDENWLPVLAEARAFKRFSHLQSREALPALRQLLGAAQMRALSFVLDDTQLTLGSGIYSRSYPIAVLPSVEDVPWADLRDIPTAVVTGSNGKTTTVRLLAACARAQGLNCAFNCTDGVYLNDELLASGDYSGPEGTRRVLREPRARAAILETARGGILRRGIAAARAQVAVVTNVSSDHFGEYGIHDLDDLAAVKLSVARIVATSGLLVLNRDDLKLWAARPALRQTYGERLCFGWFSAQRDASELQAECAAHEACCAPQQGRLLLTSNGATHDLGAVESMPLTMGGVALYNVANVAGAALAAQGLGISAALIAAVLSRFGARNEDNPGRLMRFARAGVTILLDYAHNPSGLWA